MKWIIKLVIFLDKNKITFLFRGCRYELNTGMDCSFFRQKKNKKGNVAPQV